MIHEMDELRLDIGVIIKILKTRLKKMEKSSEQIKKVEEFNSLSREMHHLETAIDMLKCVNRLLYPHK